MIYLDTHVVIWLYGGRLGYFSEPVKELLRENDLFISPIVCLEIQYLFDIDRIDADTDSVLADLAQRIGLSVCQKSFSDIMANALQLTWTRDPFDRIIVAHASVGGNILVSKDEMIQAHYLFSRW